MPQRTSAIRITDLHRQPVVMVTDAGVPISVGRIRVIGADESAAALRVELVFKTERLECVLRVRHERWPVLLENWDGETTRYVLPHGDGFWLDANDNPRITERLNASSTPNRKRRGPPTQESSGRRQSSEK